MKKGKVISVNKSSKYSFSKQPVSKIEIVKGLGVEGDIHSGDRVKHRSRVRRDPTQPNLRQVHLIHSELFESLVSKGYEINPGDIGENITTTGIDLLSLPKNTILKVGATAEIKITGLRNPCQQLNNFQAGLMQEVAFKDETGNFVSLTGVMSIVLESGTVHIGDEIEILLPEGAHTKLEIV